MAEMGDQSPGAVVCGVGDTGVRYRGDGVRQRGFLLYVGLAAGIAIIGLGIALKVQSARLESEQAEHQATQAKFDAFVTDTKRIGLEAQKKADAEKIRQDQVNKERAQDYEKRLASINDAYKRLRDGRSGSGSSPVPAIPSGPITVDDAASRDRLLEVLYHADRNTSQLIELQQWVREQAR